MFRLINSSPLMIFMKGKPSDPRCKFSRALIELLDSNNLIYETFDILIDNDIREGLKKHSHWPTYPQVYVKGVLVGGLDIVQELIASKEFFSLLPSSCYKESAKALHARLKNLIQTSKVVLFMKGTPDQPKCGFSKTMVDLLKSSDIGKFETFDVLSDEHVRQGLKEYSNWPTYPQLYVKGQLVGGVDVVKQLVETVAPHLLKVDFYHHCYSYSTRVDCLCTSTLIRGSPPSYPVGHPNHLLADGPFSDWEFKPKAKDKYIILK
ncbi:glutaredoxin 3-like [Zophobas morio]|uniref:glutaredoxin 3-like n=1 Tax=Zophobas morio TaxID=2755281 RepID=UPI003083617E